MGGGPAGAVLTLLFRLPLLRNLPLVRALAVRLVGFGIRREHVAPEIRNLVAVKALAEAQSSQ